MDTHYPEPLQEWTRMVQCRWATAISEPIYGLKITATLCFMCRNRWV